MNSLLIITPIEQLQDKINTLVTSFKNIPGIYVCLNKTQKSTEDILKKAKINTNKLFFIDCVTSEKIRNDVLHISPTQLDLLNSVINSFMEDIKQEKFLIIDALSTLLIYNNEDKVKEFIKNITEYASKNNFQVIAISPETRGEELLDKISNFFDNIEKYRKVP